MHVYILTYTTTTVFTTGTLVSTKGNWREYMSDRLLRQPLKPSRERHRSRKLHIRASALPATSSYQPTTVRIRLRRHSRLRCRLRLPGVKPVTKTLPVSKTTTTVTSYNTVKTVTLVTTDLTVTHGITQTATTSATATVSTYTVETAVTSCCRLQPVCL